MIIKHHCLMLKMVESPTITSTGVVKLRFLVKKSLMAIFHRLMLVQLRTVLIMVLNLSIGLALRKNVGIICEWPFLVTSEHDNIVLDVYNYKFNVS